MNISLMPRGYAVVAVLIAFGLSACGGGGDGSSVPPAAVVPAPSPTPTPAPTPLAVAATSYENAKGLNIDAQKLPYSTYSVLARGYADFLQRGQRDLFVAHLTYDVSKPIAQATPGTFEFWKKQADGSYVKDTTLLADSTGCLHPRKAAIADFNEDGKPDVFVACHGYDASPFPGEKSAVVLSQPDGKYKTSFINYVAFAHSAAAADLNGDGHVDVVITDPYRDNTGHVPVVLLGDGKGNFTVDTNVLPTINPGTQIYSMEATDVNGDGKVDLMFAGGDDGAGYPAQAAPPTIYLNDGSGTFAHAAPKVLPAVLGTHGIDLALVNGKLYVNRTSSQAADFYKTRVLQRIDLATNASDIVVNDVPTNSTPWIEWYVPLNGKLISDNVDNPFSYALP